MSALVSVGGQRSIYGLTPADTNEATMLTAGKDSPVVVGIRIVNLTGSAANATVKWGNGATDFAICDTKSVAARDYLDVLSDDGLPFLPLREGYTIKVTSGTGGALAFTLITVSTGSTLYGPGNAAS